MDLKKVPYTPLDDVPPPAAADPLAVFAQLAAAHGLIKPGDPLDRNLIDLCFDVVEACARVGDRYGDPEAGGNAGEDIRAQLGDL